MFITVCGWAFCFTALVILVFVAGLSIQQSGQIEYWVKCDPQQNNGVGSRLAKGTWYGWRNNKQKKIIAKILIRNCVLCVLPFVWVCIILMFAI